MTTIIILITTVIVSFICFQRQDILYKLSFNPYRIWHHKEWSRFITHGFVHADMVHLFVNMFTFYSFGRYMESLFEHIGFGQWAFIGLYFGGMIVASVHDLLKYRDYSYYNSIGASGAVSAVLFSAIFFDPWSKIYLFAIIPVPGLIFGFVYLFYCQYMARQSRDNINHNAHFYGALFGFFFPMFLRPELVLHFFSRLLAF